MFHNILDSFFIPIPTTYLFHSLSFKRMNPLPLQLFCFLSDFNRSHYCLRCFPFEFFFLSYVRCRYIPKWPRDASRDVLIDQRNFFQNVENFRRYNTWWFILFLSVHLILCFYLFILISTVRFLCVSKWPVRFRSLRSCVGTGPTSAWFLFLRHVLGNS